MSVNVYLVEPEMVVALVLLLALVWETLEVIEISIRD